MKMKHPLDACSGRSVKRTIKQAFDYGFLFGLAVGAALAAFYLWMAT